MSAITVTLILAMVQASASNQLSADSPVAKPETDLSKKLVSLVFGCIEVSKAVHSYSNQNLVDAFAGKVAETADSEPLLNWASGMWAFDTLVSSFQPFGDLPSEPEGGSRLAKWIAFRDGQRYLLAISSRVLLFAEAPQETDLARLEEIFASYRRGREKCDEAEGIIPVAFE